MMENDDEDARSVVTSTSELSPNSPFTQEQVDAVRGFVKVTRELADLKKVQKNLATQLKSHRDVLIELLQSRKKTKLALENDVKIQLTSTSVQKKPQGPQLFNLIESTLREEGGDTYSKLIPKIEKSMKESETTVEKQKLVLEEPGKNKKVKRN